MATIYVKHVKILFLKAIKSLTVVAVGPLSMTQLKEVSKTY
jgi:hypothetical protein